MFRCKVNDELTIDVLDDRRAFPLIPLILCTGRKVWYSILRARNGSPEFNENYIKIFIPSALAVIYIPADADGLQSRGVVCVVVDGVI